MKANFFQHEIAESS